MPVDVPERLREGAELPALAVVRLARADDEMNLCRNDDEGSHMSFHHMERPQSTHVPSDYSEDGYRDNWQ